jgi:hypothetical protein
MTMNHDEAHMIAHQTAIAEQTAERYLLGDLSDAEADAFERHYFDCRVCGDTIRAGATMFAAGREVAGEAAEPFPVSDAPSPAPQAAVLPFRPRAQQWMSVAAAAVLAFVLGTQFRPTPSPGLPPLEIAAPGGAITGVTRAADDDLIVHFEGQQPVEVVITPDPQPECPEYWVEVRDASGKVLHAVAVSPRQARHIDGVPVLLRALPAGRYVLAILGVREDGNRPVLARRNVVVQ